MLKYFNIESVYEFTEGVDEEELEKICKLMENDKSGLIKINKTLDAFFLEEDKEKLFNKYPILKDFDFIYDFDDYIENTILSNGDDLEIGDLRIDYDDVVSFVKNTYLDVEEFYYNLMEVDDFEKEYEKINKSIMGKLISSSVLSIIEKASKEYEIDYSMIEMGTN